MAKRSSYDIKRKILLTVKEKPASYAELERKVNTGYRTIKANCEELQDYDFIDIKTMKEHPANARPSHVVLITDKGIETLQKKKTK